MKRRKPKLQTRLLLLCYAVFLLAWGVGGAVHMPGDARRQPQALSPGEAEMHNLALAQDGSFVTEGIDAQLVFSGIDAPVRTVRLRAAFAWDPGEMELFYSRKEGQGFSVRQRVIGVPQNDGSWLYTLPAGQVHALRLDPGTAGGNTVVIDELVLNPRLPAHSYFGLSLRWLVTMAVVPALACCGFYTIIELVLALAARRPKRAGAGGGAT
ncbi:hypothetical protein LJC04_04575 [Ruminococcaceae bacterium OttesenSCG-928-O06]|nr:hypothetical protein [Ruminococcaceae bacterium OttesenSCG-928-O06]